MAADLPTSHGSPAAPAAEHGPGYETRDVRLKPIIYSAVALVVAAAAINVGIWFLFALFAAREATRVLPDRPLAAELRRSLPPEPRLQHAPLEDLETLRAWEDRLLTTYAVVDREAGVVRIPIERAVELVAERGLAVRRSAVAESAPALQAPAEPQPQPGSQAAPAPEEGAQ